MKEAGKDALAKQAANIVELVGKKAPGFVRDQYKNGELIINRGLPDYLQANYHKCETVRTLIRRDAPTLLDDIYEPPNFRIERDDLTQGQIVSRIGGELQNTIVSGLAGSGKSMFLKKLFRESIQQGYTFYPIFFELRSVSSEGGNSLLDELFQSIAKYVDGFSQKQFEFGLRRGLFFLMIDALDEAPLEKRNSIESQIIELSRKYPNCPLVVTSRPSQNFSSWEGFYTAHLLPFTKEQCLSFIERIEFARERKEEFAEALKGGMFEEQSEFLSNPLLATMMLLTFDEYGEIPARRHVFFEKCFQVLLREHDVSKGQYRRQFKSRLDYEDLEEIFTYFCVLSYLDRKFMFSEAEITSYLKDAIASSSADCSPKDTLFDLVNSISIIQQEGDTFEFTHRSFQEYFYAKFAVSDRDHSLVEKIAEIPDAGDFDDSVRMIADMDKSYFEKSFILPRIRNILAKIDEVDVGKRPDMLLKQFFQHVAIRYLSDWHGDESDENRQLRVVFGISTDPDENPEKRLNIVVFTFCHRYFGENAYPRVCWPTDEELLAVCGHSGDVKSMRRYALPLHHSNRGKLIALGAGRYAQSMKERIVQVRQAIEQSLETRQSKLATKLRGRG